ncbi:hypothetical protein DEJ17_06335 [Curtobacterium sp. MCSS17_011]|nr:hypothetical protein DEJ17_06335 [Curtobacterium sp. MCSS17_011]
MADALRAGEVEKGYRNGWYSEDRLIVGTAGNPELLDAIDGLLEAAERYTPGTFRVRAERIAAAIIAADERMSA